MDHRLIFSLTIINREVLREKKMIIFYRFTIFKKNSKWEKNRKENVSYIIMFFYYHTKISIELLFI